MYSNTEEKRVITFEEFAALGVTKDMLFCLWRHRGGGNMNAFLAGQGMGYFYDDTNLIAGRYLVLLIAGRRVIEWSSPRLDDDDVLAKIATTVKANSVFTDLLVQSQMQVLFTFAVNLGWSKISTSEMGLHYDKNLQFELFHGNCLDMPTQRPEHTVAISRENLLQVAPSALGSVILALASTIEDRMATIFQASPSAVDQWFALVPFAGGMRGEITTTCGDFSHSLVFTNPDLIDIDTGKTTPQLDYLLKVIKF